MNHRNRVRMALNHCEPDRVPMDIGSTYVSTIHRNAYVDLLEYLGLKDEKMEILGKNVNTMIVGEELMRRFELDCVRLALKPSSTYREEYDEKTNSFYDEYGQKWQKSTNDTGIHYPVSHPLKGWSYEEIRGWKMPDQSDPARYAGLREEAKHLFYETDYAIVGDGMWLTFQKCSDMYGMEDFLCDLLMDEPKARLLLDKIAENNLDSMHRFMQEVGDYVDIVSLGDDLGSQNGPLISPEIYRRILKPYHKLYVEEIRRMSNGRAKIFFHCDGAIMDFMDDIVDVGFDILNPVQCAASGMDPSTLKKRYGDEISFWGSVNAQHVMSRGSVQDVIDETKRMIDIFGPGGGFVLGNAHVIEHGFTPQNITALFDTGLSYGKYYDY